jgi:hypothetical protein
MAKGTEFTTRASVAIGGLKRKGTPVEAHVFRGQSWLPPGSGCASVVAVMEAAHLRDSNDASEF